MIQDFLKGLKDGALGLLISLLPLVLPQAGAPVKIGLVVAGIVVMVLGVVTNTVTNDFHPLTTWGKVAKDFILGFCASSIPLIQQGANAGTDVVMILGTVMIGGLSVFSNVIQQKFTANTILAKVVKDYIVLGLAAVVPILSDALSSHQSLVATLGTIGAALLTVGANVIKSDFLGHPSQTAGASSGETWP